jgi:uncharacterized damage-inducible protein DinB
MDKELSQLLEQWSIMRQLTLDLLDELPEEHLSFSVGENMGTIGKQYRHIGDVQLCYSEAIKNGKIDFSKYRRDYSIENSKEKLKEFLLEVDGEMVNSIEENPDLEIDWFGEKWNLQKHIKALIEHEILHHGELVVYIRVLGLKFPKSWGELWGL